MIITGQKCTIRIKSDGMGFGEMSGWESVGGKTVGYDMRGTATGDDDRISSSLQQNRVAFFTRHRMETRGCLGFEH